MKKMYLARATITAMFLSDEKENTSQIAKAAGKFLQQEAENYGAMEDIIVNEITKVEDIPRTSKGTNLWNSEIDLTPEEFLADKLKADPEYVQYLRLKEKFRKYEEIE